MRCLPLRRLVFACRLGALCWVLGAPALVAQAPAQGPLPILPLTQLDERALVAELDNRAVTLTYPLPVPIRDLLLQLVRGTSLSVVPDPSISGTFSGELKNVTVRQALGLILPPLGLDYAIEGPVIRVFSRDRDTRIFDLSYIATSRTGNASVGGASPGGSSASVTSTTGADLFAEITRGVQTLISERGAFNVDRKAGLLQVSDFPERIERVALYLDTVLDHVHRQVQIDARILEVELQDPAAQALDWSALIKGQRVTDVNQFLAALSAQGRVTFLATPRVLAMNNEAAIVRAVSQRPTGEAGASGSVTLEVTPQIGDESVITLSVSPIVAIHEPGENGDRPALTTIREADTLARVANGETLVVGGLTRDRHIRLRDPGGVFGRSRTIETVRKVELVIMLTPRILTPPGTR